MLDLCTLAIFADHESILPSFFDHFASVMLDLCTSAIFADFFYHFTYGTQNNSLFWHSICLLLLTTQNGSCVCGFIPRVGIPPGTSEHIATKILSLESRRHFEQILEAA
jgi:hypothetical protein